MAKKPIIAMTMGDPAGVGPEIVVKSFTEISVYDVCRPLLVGDAGVMKLAIDAVGTDLDINIISHVSEAKFIYGIIDVLDLKNIDLKKFEFGKLSAMCGKAAFEYIKKVIDLAMAGEVDATVTAPLNKEALNLAGYQFEGHTEIYAHFTNTEKFTMMLAEGNLRVTHVSTHCSLLEACKRVKKDRVLDVIKLSHEACLKMGIEKPRVGVAALNPHGGEGGLFGDEEINEIRPAVEEAKRMGIDATGPWPADSIFAKARGRRFDIVVAMYHDQGHNPLKVVGFDWDEDKMEWTSIRGVNVTLGLPIIRSSVDHGTAFEMAGRGIANHESMMNAIIYGARMTGMVKI